MQDGVESLPPVDATLIVGGLLLHSHLSAIGNFTSYDNLARNLLIYVCSYVVQEIHVLFDQYLPA